MPDNEGLNADLQPAPTTYPSVAHADRRSAGLIQLDRFSVVDGLSTGAHAGTVHRTATQAHHSCTERFASIVIVQRFVVVGTVKVTDMEGTDMDMGGMGMDMEGTGMDMEGTGIDMEVTVVMGMGTAVAAIKVYFRSESSCLVMFLTCWCSDKVDQHSARALERLLDSFFRITGPGRYQYSLNETFNRAKATTTSMRTDLLLSSRIKSGFPQREVKYHDELSFK